jgi:enamine deaminase RidA (YjgF/YER057c/UK114 family)
MKIFLPLFIKPMNNAITFNSQLTTDLHVDEAGKAQMFLTAVPTRDGAVDIVVENIYNAITAVLRERGAEIVHERIFGGLRAEDKIMVSRKHALEKQGIISESPVTYIEGNPSDGSGFAGVIIRVVVPQHVGDVWTIFDEGVPCGRGWRRNGIEFIILQNIQGRNQSSVYPHLTSPIKGEEPHERQVQAVIERAERILREQGASYHDVVRTWFYLSDILSWYSEFNEVRNSKYSEFGIMPVPGRGQFILPASTGIGGINPRKSAAVMDLLAITGPPERTSPSGRSPSSGHGRCSTDSGATRACVITSTSPAPTRASRTTSRTASGDGLYAGIPVRGRRAGTVS